MTTPLVISSNPVISCKRILNDGDNAVCELMGISSSVEIRPGRHFSAFRRRGQELPEGRGNPDGWGVAWYPDGKAAQVIKEPFPAASSQLSKFLSNYQGLYSQIFICHVRKASRGAVTYSNSHPFSREVHGRDYVFAHNGTIHRFQRSPLGHFKPVGSTDSERLFCYILNFIEESGICDWREEEFLEFWKFLVGINRIPTMDSEKPNKVNLLLSDGETLLSYTDLYGRGSLHRLLLRKRVEGFSEENGSSECRTSMDGTATSIAVVATIPVPRNKRWIAMEPGELCALRNGEIVFSSMKAATR